MKIAVFDSHDYDRSALMQANESFGHELTFLETSLSEGTASLASGFPAICLFVHDHVNSAVAALLKKGGTSLVALRCAGFNNIDLLAAEREKLHVVRVPDYSPYAVAEHAMALLLALNRKLPRACNRVREGNFSLDGLVGFDLHGKTVGVIGLGKIGSVFAKIARGFGCRVLGHDIKPSSEANHVVFVSPDELYAESDIISLHVPLVQETLHLINAATIRKMKPGAILINTSRGALVNAGDLVEALKSGAIAGAALDVYEEEEKIFFRDLSGQVLQDDILARLLTFPNVLVTAHQAFLTREALRNIAETTLRNVTSFAQGESLKYELTLRSASCSPA